MYIYVYVYVYIYVIIEKLEIEVHFFGLLYKYNGLKKIGRLESDF